jgi:hypothetical protein
VADPAREGLRARFAVAADDHERARPPDARDRPDRTPNRPPLASRAGGGSARPVPPVGRRALPSAVTFPLDVTPARRSPDPPIRATERIQGHFRPSWKRLPQSTAKVVSRRGKPEQRDRVLVICSRLVRRILRRADGSPARASNERAPCQHGWQGAPSRAGGDPRDTTVPLICARGGRASGTGVRIQSRSHAGDCEWQSIGAYEVLPPLMARPGRESPTASDTVRVTKAPILPVTGQGAGSCGGRYWVRTSDLFGVNEARYHCANRPCGGRL